MNERIKQLAKQADPQFTGERNDDMGHALIGTEAIEKFAELIVQECVNVLHNNELWNCHISHALKEHFRVEKTEKAMQEVQKLGEEIQPDFTYSVEYDAYYYIDTGEWIDPKCGDTGCHFCNGRPKNMKAERVDKTKKDRHEKFCDNHCVRTDHHPDCPLKE